MEVPSVSRRSVTYSISEAFDPPQGSRRTEVLSSDQFKRECLDLFEHADVLLDTFPDIGGPSCCFVRLAQGDERAVSFRVEGVDKLETCPSGGWLLTHSLSDAVAYWVPQAPVLRTTDDNGRILSQRPASLAGIRASAHDLCIDFSVPSDVNLDLTVWRLPREAADLREALAKPLVLERQPLFLRSSHTLYAGPADLYACLVHGRVYDNRFVWRRIWGGFRWRICSENEAHSLYLALSGLGLATGRRLYDYLKRQVLYSVIARQAADGGWHHGEWTDRMESHCRLHNAGLLMLETAFEEQPDPVVLAALRKAAAFAAGRTDGTDLGTWYLHDALEESVEAATSKDAPPWAPARILGASPTNKLILNTHLDAIVALDRYRDLTGDTQYDSQQVSARAAARSALAMRPAEWLYRVLFGAVWLTLQPPTQARESGLLRRVARRLARDYLVPQLYRAKHRYPRFAMPGGLLDRHLSPKHFDMGYHTVNLMDVVRVWRRFPADEYGKLVDGAIKAVTDTDLLRYWVESKHRQPVGYWVEALYHLCVRDPSGQYRRLLAEGILAAADADVGLPPSLLGTDAEAVKPVDRAPCLLPADERLRIANLARAGVEEYLIVNTSATTVELGLQRQTPNALDWVGADGMALDAIGSTIRVPPRGWIVARRQSHAKDDLKSLPAPLQRMSPAGAPAVAAP